MKDCCRKTLEEAIKRIEGQIPQIEEADNETMAVVEWQRVGISDCLKVLRKMAEKKQKT